MSGRRGRVRFETFLTDLVEESGGRAEVRFALHAVRVGCGWRAAVN